LQARRSKAGWSRLVPDAQAFGAFIDTRVSRTRRAGQVIDSNVEGSSTSDPHYGKNEK
jgi:hypothetical protein